MEKMINLIENGGFYFEEQIIEDLHNAGGYGYELLARLEDNGRRVNPSEFLHVLEKNRIDAFYKTKKEYIKRLIGAGENVWINVSFADLQFGMYKFLKNEFNCSERDFIIIEVNEQLPLSNEIYECMIDIRALGCLIAIDDFGRGRAGLSLDNRVMKMADVIKFDGYWNFEGAEVSHLVNFFHKRGKMTVLEHIDSAERLQRAVEAGFDGGQGFYFGENRKVG